MPTAFKCIYCQKTTPEVTSSQSHIIPDAFGQGPILNNAVCESCNHDFNQAVETNLAKRFATLRNCLALDGRRGKPSFMGKVKFLDVENEMRFIGPKELETSLFVFKSVTGEDTKRKIAFIGDPKSLQEAQEQYGKRHPGVVWEDVDPALIEKGLRFEFRIDFEVFAAPEVHRLAAKIAFEALAWKRSPGSVEGTEFDPIRKLILKGIERNLPLCHLTTDPKILMGLGNIPFGIHAIYFDCNMNSHKILAIISLFGLAFYKVILTTRASIMANYQQLILVNPQTGFPYEPSVLLTMAKPDIHRNPYEAYMPPEAALKRLFPEMLKKLNDGFKQIYEQNGITRRT